MRNLGVLCLSHVWAVRRLTSERSFTVRLNLLFLHNQHGMWCIQARLLTPGCSAQDYLHHQPGRECTAGPKKPHGMSFQLHIRDISQGFAN